MSTAQPQASIEEILEKHVDSFDKLELVVLLAKTPGQPVARRSLVETLDTPPDELAACIHELVRSGLLVATDDTVGPADADTVHMLDRLLRAYEEDGPAVMNALSRIAMKRIRGMAARTFATAFELRPKRKRDS